MSKQQDDIRWIPRPHNAQTPEILLLLLQDVFNCLHTVKEHASMLDTASTSSSTDRKQTRNTLGQQVFTPQGVAEEEHSWDSQSTRFQET